MNPATPLPSWDLFLGLFFVVGIAYGLVMQRDKVIVTMTACYVAIVISQTFSDQLLSFFAGDKTLFNQIWIKSSASPLAVKTTIFLAVVALITSRSGLASRSSRSVMPPLEIIGHSFLNVTLVASSIFSFMPKEQQQAIAEASKLAKIIINFHIWWLILPVLLLLFTGYRRRNNTYDDY
ncbi:MAG: Uncharacterized protein CEN88_361 [Candidatus Berkelbacteria bacterium Licking1014_2]|uniref:Colicin V production protein n=1 Tax=Candidatus Berkelbacteria bacterium Licking1014_2 TaxID=2017146 RepID=A0A554LU76_9BACT|nr:MAG: Uncharacterized protein CEN88_361 [Candidatus Berkelbacteria bacterium Licking1014_2]